MAYNLASSLLLIAFILFAAANPSAHGVNFNFQKQAVTVGGQLCCTSTGNCPGQGVAGAAVLLNCTMFRVTTTVGRNTTDATGLFTINIPSLNRIILSQPKPPCRASVQLPLETAACLVLSTTAGILISTGMEVTSAFGFVKFRT